MRSALVSVLAALAAQRVAAHATFQELWVNGVDHGAMCVREPNNNSPVTDVTSNDVRCNANKGAAKLNCAVPAGATVTIEMHQQFGDRACNNEAIGGAHYGPVLAYMSKVADAAKADGSDPWFKVYQDGWSKKSGASQGSDDHWGTKDLVTNCGKLDFKIPADLAPGDYLLRAEAIALHSAQSPGGAQLYMSCFQLTVSGSGSLKPASTVSFPGAYKASDPGLQINIYQNLETYVMPGPAVIPEGTTAEAGKAGTAVTKVGGDIKTITAPPAGAGAGGNTPATSAAVVKPSSTVVPDVPATSAAVTTSAAPVPTPTPSGFTTLTRPASSSSAPAPEQTPSAPIQCPGAAAPAPTVADSTGPAAASRYAQCGGANWSGAKSCADGLTCKVMNPYYSQCL